MLIPLLLNLEEREACREDWKEERDSLSEEKKPLMEEMTGPENSPLTQQYASLSETCNSPLQSGPENVTSAEEDWASAPAARRRGAMTVVVFMLMGSVGWIE